MCRPCPGGICVALSDHQPPVWLHEGDVLLRFVLGEGIEKKTNDLAKEVEAQTKAFEEAAAKKAASAPESPAPTQDAAAEPAQVCPPPAHAVLSCRRNGSRLGIILASFGPVLSSSAPLPVLSLC